MNSPSSYAVINTLKLICILHLEYANSQNLVFPGKVAP